MTDSDTHVARQRAFYDSREHRHLRPANDDYYSRNLVAKLAGECRIASHHRVLEIGAGFGRFTFALLERCASVVALDLSQRALDDLARTRAERGIAAERCRTVRADLDSLDAEAVEAPFDFVVGFFILHHLPHFAESIRALATLLAPDGCMAFVEPNRLNPSFVAQIACCPDMSWREERGLFRLNAVKVQSAFVNAGLAPRAPRTFGLFPPQILNRVPLSRRIEARVEKVGLLRGLLPFLLLAAVAESATT